MSSRSPFAATVLVSQARSRDPSVSSTVTSSSGGSYSSTTASVRSGGGSVYSEQPCEGPHYYRDAAAAGGMKKVTYIGDTRVIEHRQSVYVANAPSPTYDTTRRYYSSRK